jgi:spore germination protein GerM
MAEKKKPAAKKNAPVKKTPAKKKPAAKTGGRKKPAAKKTQNRKTTQSAFSPVYALTIMVLLTVIVLLVNSIYFGDVKISSQQSIGGKKNISVKKPEKAEKNPVQKADDEKSGNKPESPKKRKARIYFVQFNERTEKSYLTSVKRNIDGGKPVRAALNELIRGLTPREERRGLLTAVPRELKLRNVRVRDRTAELDFNSSLQWGATGNILLNRIDQIVYTATQFENVDSVIIKINGRTRRTLGGDGLSISGPLQRRVN